MNNEEKLLDRIKKLEEENEILTREIKTAKRERNNMYSNVKVLSSAFNIVIKILDKQYYELDSADDEIVNQAKDIIYPKYDL